MVRRGGCLVLVVIGVLGTGLFITWIAENRLIQSRVYCENHLRQLGQFAGYDQTLLAPKMPNVKLPPIRTAVPAGTIPNAELPPDRRLSWVVDALPTLNQKRQDTANLATSISRTLAWDVEPNRVPSRTVVVNLLCPGNPPPSNPEAPAVTQYIGMAGINPDAALLDLGPPVPVRAGCFRYDSLTPFSRITDGLSQTILFAETNRELGPWIRGGPATVRGFDVGVPGQFDGNHPGGANFGFVDGSVRFLTNTISSDVLQRMVTIASGDDLLADER